MPLQAAMITEIEMKYKSTQPNDLYQLPPFFSQINKESNKVKIKQTNINSQDSVFKIVECVNRNAMVD